MKRLILVGLTSAVLALPVMADTLDIRDNSADGMDMPRRGLTMATVEERYGAPTRVLAAVGDPPITRWVYPEYTVYFEYERVIEPVKRTSHTGFPVQ